VDRAVADIGAAAEGKIAGKRLVRLVARLSVTISIRAAPGLGYRWAKGSTSPGTFAVNGFSLSSMTDIRQILLKPLVEVPGLKLVRPWQLAIR